MPKIIGRDESQAHRYTCRKCSTIFEYYESECRVKHGRDWSNTGYTYWEINCPQCGDLKQIER